MTPEQRTRRARIAALEQWAAEKDRTARTASARAGFEARFDRLVIEKFGALPAAEHERRRETERQLYYARLAQTAAKARTAKARGKSKP